MRRTGTVVARIGLMLALILSGIVGTITTVAGQGPVNEVSVQFHTNYWHDIQGNEFINGPVEGFTTWTSGMQNPGDDTGESAANVTSILESGLDFDWMNPEPGTSAPPDYEWSFGDINQDSGVQVDVGASSASVSYTPGFNVSRSIDPLELTESGNQTLEITVTPLESMQWLWIGVWVWEDSFLVPEILLPTTDEEAGIRLSDDGSNLNVSLDNPTGPVTIEVTIHVELKEGVASVEHMPPVQVAQQNIIDSGSTSGSAVSQTIAGLGDWTWQADGDYLWNWTEALTQGVSLQPIRPNEVSVDFNTNYWHNTSDNEFFNDEVEGNKNWTSNMQNWGDETGLPVANVTSTLESGLTFEWMNPEPGTSAPPDYEWSFGDINQDSGVQVDVGASSASVNFTPGFNVSRSIDPLELTGSGEQTMLIIVTPREAGMERLWIGVQVGEDSLLIPEITSPKTDEKAGIWLSEDGRNLNVSIQEPANNTEYLVTVTIDVELKGGVASAEHMPQIQVARQTTMDGGQTLGSTVSHTIADLGNWTWQADGDYLWNWTEALTQGVSLQPILPNEVAADFVTNYWHNTSDNEFFNDEVEGNKNWTSNMQNWGDETGQPAANVTSTLESGLTFEWMNPAPGTSAPPNYEWYFGDIGQDNGVQIDLGVGPAPVNFTPGFNVSRSIDPLELTESGEQTLEITVTPLEPGIEWLGINVQVGEDRFLIPEITSPITNEEAGIRLSDDRRNLNVTIQGPINDPVVIPVTIYVELTEGVPSAEHMPQIQVARQTTMDGGQTPGGTVSHTIADLGNWTWQADGDYLWNWKEVLTQGVNLMGYATVSFQAKDVATERHFHLSNNGLHLYNGEVQQDGSDSIYGNLFTFTHTVTPSSANIASWFYANSVNVSGRGTISGSFTIEVHQPRCEPGADGQCFQFGDIDGTISVSFNAVSYAVPDPLCKECDPSHYNFDGNFQITGGTGFYAGIGGSGTIGGTFHDHEWSGDTPNPLQKWFDFVMIGQARFRGR